MIISGIQKTSLIDYPKKICTVLFTRGCNFYCGFCHNPELVNPQKFSKQISIQEIINFLQKRIKIIDAVTITGGEPTIQKDLPEFIQKIKSIGYLIKIDTNGSNPDMIQLLIKQKLIDYIAMDIKNSLEKYKQTVRKRINIKKIKQTVEIIKNSNIDYEFRTTIIPTLHTENDIKQIGNWLKGSKKHILQQFRPEITIDPKFTKIRPYSETKIKHFKTILNKYIKLIENR